MCGRYGINKDKDILEDKFKARAISAFNRWNKKVNIAPTQEAPVIIAERPDELNLMHFGLVPHWAKDTKSSFRMINAKSEEIMDKPKTYTPLLKHSKRCLVLADGFYEWKNIDGKKHPFRFCIPDRDIFTFAGLWSKCILADQSEYFSFTILTTSPNELTKSIHDRMPVILSEEESKYWMDMDQNPNDLLGILNPYPADAMVKYEISMAINSVKNEGEELIKPVN
ncbi:hypothetical protein DN752_21175 [Echinicola strongylocentroti]|uniref:Abasic site processing protein n=1 Tax=Echinicola strongylocentroti TaxID=1795355 RepID=A0A2Z4IPH4_9BACT|nr:SOS response-associated peptidase [Echinicola strongylocentroti]AWW32456.1 hypothetical protein DN752_21175 [Echinicola strongylocentroti]